MSTLFTLPTLNFLLSSNCHMRSLRNSKCQDEMPHHYAAFHQGLHCLLRQPLRQYSERERVLLGTNTCDTSIYEWVPSLFYMFQPRKKNSLVHKWLTLV